MRALARTCIIALVWKPEDSRGGQFSLSTTGPQVRLRLPGLAAGTPIC